GVAVARTRVRGGRVAGRGVRARTQRPRRGGRLPRRRRGRGPAGLRERRGIAARAATLGHGPDRARLSGHRVAAVGLDRAACRGGRADAAVLHLPALGRAHDRAPRHRHPQRGPVLALRGDPAIGDGGDRRRLPGAGMTASPHTDPRHPRPRATSCEDHVLPERRASLWRLVAGPATWALHFLLCYVTAAVWCEKHARFPPSLELRGVLWA